MRGVVSPIDGKREGTWVLLSAALPARAEMPLGVLLIDSAGGRGWLRLRADYTGLADAEDVEVLEALEDHIRGCLAESGAESCLAGMEDSLSNVLRVGERQAVAVDAFSRAIDRLYDEHVEKLRVEPFRTHVPLYSLRAAAGGLGEEMESAAEDWVRVPEGMRLAPDIFA